MQIFRLIRLKRQSQKEVFIVQVAAAFVLTPAAIGVHTLLHRIILLCKVLKICADSNFVHSKNRLLLSEGEMNKRTYGGTLNSLIGGENPLITNPTFLTK